MVICISFLEQAGLLDKKKKLKFMYKISVFGYTMQVEDVLSSEVIDELV